MLMPSNLQVPALYEQEKNSDPLVYVKFFHPGSGWVWYVTEFDGDDTLFGLVQGLEEELGYFSLKELTESNCQRDELFSPTPLSKIKEKSCDQEEDKILVYKFTDKDYEDPTQFFNFMSKVLGDD